MVSRERRGGFGSEPPNSLGNKLIRSSAFGKHPDIEATLPKHHQLGRRNGPTTLPALLIVLTVPQFPAAHHPAMARYNT